MNVNMLAEIRLTCQSDGGGQKCDSVEPRPSGSGCRTPLPDGRGSMENTSLGAGQARQKEEWLRAHNQTKRTSSLALRVGTVSQRPEWVRGRGFRQCLTR